MAKDRKLRKLKATSTGIVAIDALSTNERPTIDEYVTAVSHYVMQAAAMNASQSKTAQIALSAALGRSLLHILRGRIPNLRGDAGERSVAGALRTARADVSEAHQLDGLRLAVELKPVNLAVGRALWNRFGDVRAFAVNIHLKFPFAVVGGVLAVPTAEWKLRSQSASADEDDDESLEEEEGEEAETTPDEVHMVEVLRAAAVRDSMVLVPTTHLLKRLARRLQRTRQRLTEADPPHLLEGVALLVYDPRTGVIDPELPAPGSGLRWPEFIDALVDAYEVRFE